MLPSPQRSLPDYLPRASRLGPVGGRRRETKKMEVFRSLKMVWGTCVLFIIMHHFVMISLLLCSTSKVDTKIRFAFMFKACKRKNILFGKKDSLP